MKFPLSPWSATALALAMACAATALARDAGAQPMQRFACPLDGTVVQSTGTDGKPSPRRYSDLEIPTRAYTNLVAVCGKCGWATWTQEFERAPSDEVAAFVRNQLGLSARRATTDPALAWQHHLRILSIRRAPLDERIGATLFATYVMKRARPPGGQDHELERRIKAVRLDTVALLEKVLADDPPRSERARLEWKYLVGELGRLTGQTAKAAPVLQGVCDQKDVVGYTVGKLACEMAGRAAMGETFEDYREGVFDIAVVPPPSAAPPIAPPASPGAPTPPAPSPARPRAPMPGMERPNAPRPGPGSVDAPAPPTITSP
ncbi:MAG: hypothetical protein EXR79_12440 [Myxococcales bacterium]|nr:hypothetical protein [Myxococcales bacterium]